MSATSVHKFLRDLRKSNLLSEEILDAAWIENATDPNDLARQLVEMNLLTGWQARMLLAGRNAFFLGKYKLLDQLGEGGMGTVFKAEQVPLGRIVAVKVMARKLVNNPESVMRFQREIQTAAALNHPNIVLAFDADHVYDTHFLVMEYIEGEDLGALAKRQKQLSIGEACEYVRQAALGLQYAFEKGMVHRDIKPSNLLLKVESRELGDRSKSRLHEAERSQQETIHVQATVKILDVGLAKFESESTEKGSLTSTGQIMGTPDYIAPEQAQNSKNADIRSDIYSLGCTLFRLLTGDLPFHGENAIERIMARALNDAPDVQSLRSEIPDSLNAVVARMLSRNPDQRYQTPGEVAEAMAPFAKLPTAGNRQVSHVDEKRIEDEKQIETAGPVIPELEEFLNQLANEAAAEEEFETIIHHVGETLQDVDQKTASGGRQPPGSTKESRGVSPGTGLSPPKTKTRITRAGKKLQQDLRQRKQAERKRMLLMVTSVAAFVALVIGLRVWYQAGETLLVIDWPENERQEATLVIDGEAVSLKADTKLIFSGRSRNRELLLTRKGYESIEQALNFARGETITFRPEWKPTAETLRQRQLAVLQKRVDTMAGGGQSASRGASQASRGASAPGSPEIVKLRNELDEFRRKNAGTAESLGAARQMSRLPWPVDRLKREDIDPYELRVAEMASRRESASRGASAPGSESEPARLRGSARQDTPTARKSPLPELVAVLGSGRLKTWGENTSLAFSPDGGTLASMGIDGTILLWDPHTAELKQTLVGRGYSPSLAFAPDGRTIAAFQNGLFLWDVESGEVRLRINTYAKAKKPVYHLEFSPDGRRLAVPIGGFGTVLYNPATGDELSSVADEYFKAFSPDGARMVLTAGDGLLRVRDVETEKVIVEWEAKAGLAAFGPTGRLLASSNNSQVKIWDPASGKELRTLPDAHGALAFHPTKPLLATGGDGDGMISLWDAETGERLRRINTQDTKVSRLTFSPDGKTLAAGSPAGMIRLWDVATGEERFKPSGHTGPVASVAMSPDGQWFASGGSWNGDGTLKLWDAATGQEIVAKGPFTGRFSVVFSPDGKTLASVSAIWDFKTGQQLHRLKGHTDEVLCVAFSPDGKTLASGANWHDKTVKLWDAATGRERSTLSGHTAPIDSVAFSPDGRSFVSSSKTVKLWNLDTGKQFDSLRPGGNVSCVAYSPDGNILATAHGEQVTLWDVAKRHDLRILHTFNGHTSSVYSATFSPDGSKLASSSADGTVRLWDPQSGDLLQTFPLAPPGSAIRQVAFTPDGRHLITANGNGTVYVLRLREWNKRAGSRQQ